MKRKKRLVVCFLFHKHARAACSLLIKKYANSAGVRFRGAIIAVGLFAFVMARRSVDRNRLEVMRSKQRILEARHKDSIEKYGHATTSGSETNS